MDDVTTSALETLLEAKFAHLEEIVKMRDGTVQKRQDRHSQQLASQDDRLDKQQMLLAILIALNGANLLPEAFEFLRSIGILS